MSVEELCSHVLLEQTLRFAPMSYFSLLSCSGVARQPLYVVSLCFVTRISLIGFLLNESTVFDYYVMSVTGVESKKCTVRRPCL